MENVLQTKEVSKDFSGKLAVDHVSIQVRRGDIYGFIGENGAGKTTLMRMVCGLAEPSGGELTLFGNQNLVSQRYRVGCTIENPALYPAMTAMENMEVQRLLLGIKDKKVCGELLEMAGLNNTGDKKAKNFSLGMRVWLWNDEEYIVARSRPGKGIPFKSDRMQLLIRRHAVFVYACGFSGGVDCLGI